MKLLDQYYNVPDRLTLIKNILFTIIGISSFTYIIGCTVAAAERATWKNRKIIPCNRK